MYELRKIRKRRFVTCSTFFGLSELHGGAGEDKEIHKLLHAKKLINSLREISCVLWNPCSLQNKLDDFISLLEDEDLDIAAITETWFTTQHNNITAELWSKGYSIYHFNRSTRKGGGVALIFRNNFKFIQGKTFNFDTFECMFVTHSHSSGLFLFLDSIVPICLQFDNLLMNPWCLLYD